MANCPSCQSEDLELDLSFLGTYYLVGIQELGHHGTIVQADFSDAPTVDELQCNNCGWTPTGHVDVEFI